MSGKLVKRILKMELPKGQSAFLWGPRKSGKSTYLKHHWPEAVYYDLLKTDLKLRLSKAPHSLREEILAMPASKLEQPIIIDEVQKVPELLDEIHWLIENTPAYFILCGSSARKLKRGAANLLGGRAWRYTFYPLVYAEHPNIDLLKVLNVGLLPTHYLSSSPNKSLSAYVTDYLQEEIQTEGLVRNLPAFAKFLDAVSFSNGEMINYSNIARDCGISSKAVKEYYQILVDTLLGYYLPPFCKKKQRDIISATNKFYLFDVGVANWIAENNITQLKGSVAGKAFEHYILMELIAYRGLKESNLPLCYWRTKTGLEVNFILGDAKIAIEVKSSQQIERPDLKGLLAFIEEHHPEKAIVVSNDPRARKIIINENDSILVLPWREFLAQLWRDEIIFP